MKKINCILLVDDDPADNYYNNYIIKDAGICNHVKTALDGVEALNYLRKAGDPDHQAKFPKPDLIFLDVNMPRMNGFEFLEAYKNLDDHLKSKILVVMLTTSLNPDDRKKASGYREINEFKNKPLTDETLHEIINKYF